MALIATRRVVTEAKMIPDPQVGVLGRLAGAAHRRRVLVVVLWLAAVAAAVGLSQVASGDFKADYTARGSDSRAAQDLLAERFPAAAGEQVDVVVRADGRVDRPGRTGRASTACSAGSPPCRTSSRRPARTGSRARSRRTAAPLLATVQLDVAEPGRHAGRGHPADHRPGRGRGPPGRAGRARRPGDRARPSRATIGSEGIGIAAAAIILLLIVRLGRRRRAADPRRAGRPRRSAPR